MGRGNTSSLSEDKLAAAGDRDGVRLDKLAAAGDRDVPNCVVGIAVERPPLLAPLSFSVILAQ